MARSDVIWLAEDSTDGVLAAFTVKNELAYWLATDAKFMHGRLTIVRMPDGRAMGRATTLHSPQEILDWWPSRRNFDLPSDSPSP